MEKIQEGKIKGQKETELLDNTKLKQKSKYICKINGKAIGTGFFCKIPYEYELIPVLITNYHVIDDNFLKENNKLKIYVNDDYKIININKNVNIYSSDSEKYDIMIIKINDEDEIKDYLELDENIFKKNSENFYKDEPIYILHFPNGDKASVSYGTGIETISEYDIKHLCNTESGSSGGPILSLLTNKIIGLHKGCIHKKGGENQFNIGTFLKFPLNELNKKNEIKIKIRIDKEDINKEIYFLDYSFYNNNLQELNENSTLLYINKIKTKYKNFFKPEKEGIYEITLRFDKSIKDSSSIFCNCDKIESIDLSKFDITNITNMSCIFKGCTSLEYLLGINNFDTKNVNNISGMFKGCSSLGDLPDISKWDISNVTDISWMFDGCNLLESLPDLKNWDTKNIINMDGLFNDCSSIKSLPDISNWNTSKVTNMSWIFNGCNLLESLPDISNWDTKNVDSMDGMFDGCSSLQSLPDISKWNITNVIGMNYMFKGCSSLKSLPDFSGWNIENIFSKDKMFDGCSSLKSLPDFSKEK